MKLKNNTGNIALIVFSLIIGYYSTYIFNYIPDPTNPRSRFQELVLFMDNECFHIHHYMWIMLTIAILYVGRYITKQIYFNMCVAFLIGCAIEGLMFKDWMLIKNDCHQEKIEKLFKSSTLKDRGDISRGFSRVGV